MSREASPVDFEKVCEASNTIKGFVHRTPVFTCQAIDRLAKRKVYFKAECFQKTGAFKARGACNAVFLEKKRNPNSPGIVTHSSGNHAQGVAYAAKCAGLSCSVVIPHDAPKIKCDAIREYGAEVIFCEPSYTSRIDVCAKVAAETGKTIIHSSENYDVIAGQGTIALEFFEEVPDLDAILVATSGGGMLAGIALTAKAIQPSCKVFAVEPVGKELQKSLEAKECLWTDPPKYLDTVADSIRLQAVGNLVFPIICENAETKVFTITDDQMIEGMKLIFERMKIVVEPSAGAGVYAAINYLENIVPPLHKVGVILCGGNVDPNTIPWTT
ncbi:serine racemase-like [Palaemon carinicauda]|uniref:serine racemase-like n=1 Tax=Palaemon carinicauda TaxID=392227 RepID=UPI0035B6909C